MIDNYFISVGGTGARILESFVNLCAAGLGPERVFVIILDLDKENGNVLKTKNLIEHYNSIRKELEPFYKRNEGEEYIKFFRTKIDYFEGHLITSPPTFRTRNLKEFFDYREPPTNETERKYNDLMKLLYTESEIKEEWTEGFKGRPYIGAPLLQFLSENLEKIEPWKSLIENLRESQGDKINIFASGSLFGGFGAAGVPIIGKVIKQYINDNQWENKDRYYFGALLSEPYFTFPINIEDVKSEKIFADPVYFPIITKLSYKFYNAKWDPHDYDFLYLIGDVKQSQVSDDFKAGGSLQLNDPHYVEMFAAFAAIDFFNNVNEHPEEMQTMTIKLNNPDKISWEDLPINNTNKEYFKFFILFNSIYKSFIVPIFKDVNRFKNKSRFYSWYIDLLKSRLFEQEIEDKNKLNLLNDYLSQFLYWIYKIHYNSEEGIRKVRLIDYNIFGVSNLENSKYNSEEVRKRFEMMEIPDEKLSRIFYEKEKFIYIYDKVHSYMCNNRIMPKKVDNLLSGDNDKPFLRFFYIFYNAVFNLCQRDFDLLKEVRNA